MRAFTEQNARRRSQSAEQALDGRSTAAPVALSVNCRWMSKPITGTERYAAEVTRALLARDDVDLTLYVPKDGTVPEWAEGNPVVRSRFTGMLFEQLALPVMTFRKHLLNLSGPAPLLKRNQSVVLFDASPFRFPRTFSRAFVAWYKILYWTLSRTTKQPFTISEFSANEIAEVVRVPSSRLVVALCGADHAAGVTSVKPELDVPSRFVLCVGTLAERKNLTPVLRAFGSESIQTIVVGAAGSSRVFARTSGLGESSGTITFANRLTDAEVYWLMENATALVFPSVYEGFGLPVVEAQMRNCPVICADSSSLPEVTAGSALLFDPMKPEEAVSLVRKVETESGLRERLIDDGRRNAERFTWAGAARTIVETLRSKGRSR